MTDEEQILQNLGPASPEERSTLTRARAFTICELVVRRTQALEVSENVKECLNEIADHIYRLRKEWGL